GSIQSWGRRRRAASHWTAVQHYQHRGSELPRGVPLGGDHQGGLHAGRCQTRNQCLVRDVRGLGLGSGARGSDSGRCDGQASDHLHPDVHNRLTSMLLPFLASAALALNADTARYLEARDHAIEAAQASWKAEDPRLVELENEKLRSLDKLLRP